MKREMTNNKLLITFFLIFTSAYSQQSEPLNLKRSNNLVYSADELAIKNDFKNAEGDYRKALSKLRNNKNASYNLGNTYFNNQNFEEALFRYEEALKHADSKKAKHDILHNIGNILMKQERCKEAVEIYKRALRFDPKDDETRYNFALAKQCMENQSDKNQDDDGDDEENKDEDKEKDKEQDQSDNNKQNEEGDDKEDKNKKDSDQNQDGDDKEDDKGKPNKNNEGDDKNKQNQPKQQQQSREGQLSPQQIKNLLEAMNNQEQKVQKKINKEKQKGVKIKTDKDW